MDIKKSTGALAFFKKLLRKVIVWKTLEAPKHSIPYSDEYIPTPTIAYKYLRGRRLNFEDPTLFKEPSDISEDESDSDDELTPQRGGVSLQSLGQMFYKWPLFGFDLAKDVRKTAKEEDEQHIDETEEYIFIKIMY